MKLIKEFLKPDLRKIVIFLILFLVVSLSVLIIVSKFFVGFIFLFMNQVTSTQKAFILCTNITQNTSSFRECYINETKKTGPVLDEISKKMEEETKTYFYSINIIYPGVLRFFEPLSNCLFIGYIKYMPEFGKNELGYIIDLIMDISDINNCYYQSILEVSIMFVYFYLISCLIIWIYDKVKKR
ncbi:MAG: hypothetical protein NTW30_02600 [Candidatus Aenigmarchaeota archaeon]|nr:hypothetical protein [Candidatus Aenigmarchaeota archaeon]